MRITAWVVCLACAVSACGGDNDDASRDEPSGSDAGPDTRRDGSAIDEPARDAAADTSTPEPSEPEAGSASPVCSRDGFCWELPTPQGESLRAAWAAADDDIWAVGDHGVVLRYDGERFRSEPALTTQDLIAVHGTSASDVWVLGEGGVVLHYDGQDWSMDDLGMQIDASGGAMTGVLHGLYAASASAVWAVGHSGVAAVILHYDGEQWSNQGVSLQRPEVLRAVWGSSPEHVWAVGDAGVILVFDGAQWSAAMSPTRSALTSVHGLTDHDVWAVGAMQTAVHWDGTQWTVANMGLVGNLHSVRVDIDTEPPALDAGMAPAQMDPVPMEPNPEAGPPPAPEGPWRVWAFGDDGRVFRYNGTLWVELPSGSEHAFYGAARIEEGELFAVGERGQISRFSGDSRQSLSAGSRRNHLALWSDGETTWAVGDEIARRTASGWSVMESPTDRSLYSAWGNANGFWAVGTAGTIVRYQDDELSLLEVPAAGDTWLRGVSGVGESVWVVGNGGLALVNAAGSFLSVDTKVRTNLLDVWGSSDDWFWAVGEGGTVLRWDGVAWLPVPTGPGGGVVQNLRAVWGSDADDVWVVGTESTILHWDGTRFVAQSLGMPYSLNDVWGYGADDVYAVGTGGTALHYDGKEWTELTTGTQSSLQSVFGDDAGRVFAAGLDGVLLVLDP